MNIKWTNIYWVNVWMNIKWMNERTNERMNERMNEWTTTNSNAWTNKWISWIGLELDCNLTTVGLQNERISESVNKRMSECNGWIFVCALVNYLFNQWMNGMRLKKIREMRLPYHYALFIHRYPSIHESQKPYISINTTCLHIILVAYTCYLLALY